MVFTGGGEGNRGGESEERGNRRVDTTEQSHSAERVILSHRGNQTAWNLHQGLLGAQRGQASGKPLLLPRRGGLCVSLRCLPSRKSM